MHYVVAARRLYFSVYSSALMLQAAVEQKGKEAERSGALVQLSIQ